MISVLIKSLAYNNGKELLSSEILALLAHFGSQLLNAVINNDGLYYLQAVSREINHESK